MDFVICLVCCGSNWSIGGYGSRGLGSLKGERVDRAVKVDGEHKSFLLDVKQDLHKEYNHLQKVYSYSTTCSSYHYGGEKGVVGVPIGQDP